MPVFNFRNMCLGLVAIAALVFSAPMLQAQTWVGSTGTVDPNSVNLVKYINGRVELRNDAPVGSVAFIRYNVLPVRDLAADLQGISYRVFDARFLDNGAGHVFLSLIQLNQSTGALTTLMTFDSNSSPQAILTSGQTRRVIPRSIFTWADSEAFNPDDCVYYVEAPAQSHRHLRAGRPGRISIKMIVP